MSAAGTTVGQTEERKITKKKNAAQIRGGSVRVFLPIEDQSRGPVPLFFPLPNLTNLSSMAHLVRSVLRRGAASGGLQLVAAPTNVEIGSRAMSTSWMAKSAGSVLGRYSVKVRGRLAALQYGVIVERRSNRCRGLGDRYGFGCSHAA